MDFDVDRGEAISLIGGFDGGHMLWRIQKQILKQVARFQQRADQMPGFRFGEGYTGGRVRDGHRCPIVGDAKVARCDAVYFESPRANDLAPN